MRKDFAEQLTSQATEGRPSRNIGRPQPAVSLRAAMSRLRGLVAWRPAHGVLAAVALLVLFWMLSISGKDVMARTGIPHEEWLKAVAVKEAVVPAAWKHEAIRRGDAAAPVLQRMGYSYNEVSDILKAAKPVYSLAHVRAGAAFTQHTDDAGTELFYPVDDEHTLRLQQQNGVWKAEMQPRVAFTRQQVFAGEIKDSLFLDAARAGLDDRTTMNLVDIFAWDIDFVRDLRDGDSFRVLTEDRFDAEGNPLGSIILAAEFVNQGQVYRAVRYTSPDGRTGYYTPDGKSMRKNFLKAPVKYTRISSRFTLHRMHPILGYTRAHKGVDYAAPIGTPIHAVGDGRVIYKGWKGGYGRFVLIRHLDGIHSTAYGHMHRFAKGIHVGSRVRQGQVIGYVGMSGLATGPHLHFEFRINGRQVNPLTIKRKPARPVPASQMARFRSTEEARMQVLGESPTMLAWG